MADGVSITVDGSVLSATADELLIAACERNGVYIPRFCYHPRMESVGMCRMCLVEVDTGRGPALQPSCMVPVSDDMRVRTSSEAAKKAQDGVLEFLLANHPLDCPVCDKGGECPLQDQTMAYGPGESRFVEEKRHFSKPIAISGTVYLDRERCILCDRCTRFADRVAGDPLIHFMGRGAHSEVNVFPDEPFSSYFSGNTVQICPVGALTAVPYRFKARPWDLTETVSTAWVDSVGARVSVQASRNRVLRLLGVDCDVVNWGWLSDKERFAFEALNSGNRLRAPLVRREAADVGGDDEIVAPADAALVQTTWKEAVTRTVDALSAAAPERIAVLGGARLTNEAQYAWAKLAKGVLGTDNVDAQLGDGLDAGLVFGLPRATIDDACRPDSTVVLLGPDPKEELGSLYLRLRHAVTRDSVTLVEIRPCAGGMSGLAAHSLRPRPGETAVLVRCLVDAVLGMRSRSIGTLGDVGESSDASSAGGRALGVVAGVRRREIVEVARALAAASDGVTVILGRPSLAEPAEIMGEAAAVLTELPSVRFLSALRRGNVHGALDMGLVPGWLPGRIRMSTTGDVDSPFEGLEVSAALLGGVRLDADTAAAAPEARGEDNRLIGVWPRLPVVPGLDARGILEAAAEGGIDALVLLGVDPLNDFVDRDLAARGLRGAAFVVAMDMFVNDSAALAADVVLPAAGPTEDDGTFTNLEGRASFMGHKVTPPGTARPDWAIAAELAARLGSARGVDLGFDSPRAIRAELSRVSAVHGPLAPEALPDDPIEGVLLSGTGVTPAVPPLRSTRRPMAPRGGDDTTGLRLVAVRTMYDDGVMLRECPSIRGLARPAAARVNSAELESLGLADGAKARVTAVRGQGRIGGQGRINREFIDVVLVADSGVPDGTLVVPWLAPGAPCNTLITAGAPFTRVLVSPRR